MNYSIPFDLNKEIDIGISKITRDLKIKDAKSGKIKCPRDKTTLRYTIHGKYFCPKCLRYY